MSLLIMKRILAVICILGCLMLSCEYTNQTADSQVHYNVSKTLEQLVMENKIPGISFSVIFSDGTLDYYSAGFADTVSKSRLNKDHVLFSGSIGKTYAVALIMQMADAGQLHLDDYFMDYFPEHEWLGLLPNIDKITILNLLQHNSGLPRYVMQEVIWDSLKMNPDKIWSYEDRLSVLFNQEAVHETGEDWSYSDTNYILLGMLIEKLSQQEYYRLLQAKVLDPLSLKETYAANHRDITNLPVGYSRLPEMFEMPGVVVTDGIYAFNPQMEWTGGGMASTTPDLCKWAKYYYEANLFSDSLVTLMTTVNPNGKMIAENTSYGSGSFIYNTKFGTAYGHTGFVPGFVSIFAYFRQQKMSVAMQINCDYAKEKMSLLEYLERILQEGYGLQAVNVAK